MKNATRIVYSSLAAVLLIAAAWATPHRTANTGIPNATNQTPQLQSVSGKIASIEKSSFTLTVAAEHTSTPGQRFQDPPASPKTMSFMIDQNTTIDGKLKVGSSAEVTYRQANGNNVAVSVRVTP
jgi:Cu/Ag efflux protein CusF